MFCLCYMMFVTTVGMLLTRKNHAKKITSLQLYQISVHGQAFFLSAFEVSSETNQSSGSTDSGH